MKTSLWMLSKDIKKSSDGFFRALFKKGNKKWEKEEDTGIFYQEQ